MNNPEELCTIHDQERLVGICKAPTFFGNKMCLLCLQVNHIEPLQCISLNSFKIELQNFRQSIERIRISQLEQLELIEQIQLEQDRFAGIIDQINQPQTSLNNFIRTSQNCIQSNNFNLSDHQINVSLRLLNQSQQLQNIDQQLRTNINLLRNLRINFANVRENILQDIYSINQILNDEESTQQENQIQQQQSEELSSSGSIVQQSYNSRIESPVVESIEQVIQNQQQQSDESLYNSQKIFFQSQIVTLQNQTIIINLVFDHLVTTYEVEIDPYMSIGDLVKEFKILLNHQNEILFLYEGNVLEEELSFQQLKIQNGYTLQGQLQY